MMHIPRVVMVATTRAVLNNDFYYSAENEYSVFLNDQMYEYE